MAALAPLAPSPCLDESQILRPIDKIDLDSNSWPIFVLSDVTVFRADGTTLVNAMAVGEEGPFVVRGRLEIDDDMRPFLLDPHARSPYIEVKDSALYSLGYPPPTIWLSGHAGWFEITPSQAYTPLYRDMCDACTLYYTLHSLYGGAESPSGKNGPDSNPASLSIRDILFEYAAAVGDGLTYDEVVEKCIRLGRFLVAHCLRTNELPWKETKFYAWLTREMKGRERADRRSSRGVSVSSSPAPSASTPVPPPPPPPSTLPLPLPSRQLPLRTTPQPPRTRLSKSPLPPTEPPPPPLDKQQKPHKPPPPPTPTPMALDDTQHVDIASAVFAKVLPAVIEIGNEFDRDLASISPSAVHGKLFNKFRLDHYVVAKDLAAYFSRQLLEALDKHDPRWGRSPFAAWMRRQGFDADASRPFLPASPNWSLVNVSTQLVRRIPQSSVPSSASAAGKTTPPHQAARVSGKRAGLRPPLGSKKRPHSSLLESDEDDEDADSGPRETRETGETGETSEASTDAAPNPRGRRLRRRKIEAGGYSYSGYMQQAAEEERQSAAMAMDEQGESASEEGGHQDDDDDDDDDSVRDRMSAVDEEAAQLVVRSVPLLQSTAPTGPSRTWRCLEPGCGFFVRDAGADFATGEGGGAEKSESPDPGVHRDDDDDDGHVKIAQEMVRQHIRGHEQDTLNKVDLAITEGSRQHISVSHLVEKIRSLGEKSRASAAAAAATMTNLNGAPAAPTPIVRQFLV